jgi:hypothetical protein
LKFEQLLKFGQLLKFEQLLKFGQLGQLGWSLMTEIVFPNLENIFQIGKVVKEANFSQFGK